MFWSACGGTCWTTWPFNCGSCLVTCFRFGISTIGVGRCASSWGCCGLGMVWNVRTYGLIIASCICFFLLIIRGLSSFSSSFEFSIGFCSLACICLGDLLDKARGHLICHKCSFNFEILIHEVETFYTLVGICYNGIYWVVSSFFGSTLIVPIMTVVWEVVHFINYLCSCFKKMSTNLSLFLA